MTIGLLALLLAVQAPPPSAAAPSYPPAAEAALTRPVLKEVNLEISRIRRDFAAQVSRIYFAPDPEWHVVVVLKRSANVADRTVRFGGKAVKIRMVEDPAALTQFEVEERVSRALPQIAKLLPTLNGTAVDVATGEVMLDVYAVGADIPRVRAKKAAVEALIGYPVRIEPSPGRVTLQGT